MNEYNDLPEGLLTALFALVIIGLVVGIMLYCAYLKNLQDLLKAVREHNRLMPPAQVWLLAVVFVNLLVGLPAVLMMREEKVDMRLMSGIFSGISAIRNIITLFILYWQFRVVQRIADSIDREYQSRNIAVGPRPTYQVGLAYVLSLAAGFVLDFLSIRYLNLLTSIVALVFWIMYWIKTAQFKKALQAMPSNPDEESPLFRDIY